MLVLGKVNDGILSDISADAEDVEDGALRDHHHPWLVHGVRQGWKLLPDGRNIYLLTSLDVRKQNRRVMSSQRPL